MPGYNHGNAKYSQKTVALLFGLAGNRCAYPDCPNRIIADETEFDEAAVTGHIAHIYGVKSTGPRPHPDMNAPKEVINGFDNLVLLCRTHHGEADVQSNTFTVEEMTKWKNNHLRKNLASRSSFLPSKFRHAGEGLEIFTEDALIASAENPIQKMEALGSKASDGYSLNTYTVIWLQRDNGTEFSLSLKNQPAPGRPGSRITIVAATDATDTLLFAAYNHSDQNWKYLNSARQSFDFTMKKFVLLSGIGAILGFSILNLLYSFYVSDNFIKYQPFVIGISLAVFIGHFWIKHIKLWKLLENAKNNVKIS